jgi:hypothetical protein
VRNTYRYRSFFWPALLILAGVIALLVNTGQIPVERLDQLVDLWPLILVVIGLELIVRRSVRGVPGDVAAALIVLLAIVGAAAYVSVAPNPSATHTLESSHAVGSIDQASVEIDVGAATVEVAGTTDVGSDLYRAHIEYSGPQPKVELDEATGGLKISQSNTNFTFFQNRRFTLRLQLNPGIPWTFTQNSGASTDTIDVSKVHVTNLKLNTGAGKDDITLGPPSGVVPVEVNGGALTVHVHRPPSASASITVSGGAVNLVADGKSFHAVGKVAYQTTLLGTDRYEIRINGGACTATLDTRASQ